jgi:uncharacterized protein (DUF885 family)
LKKHLRLTGWQILAVCLFLLSFLGLTFFLLFYRRDEQMFARISGRLFREELSANTLNMHYSLAYPADFGIYNYKVSLPCYSGERRLMSQAKTENVLAALRSLDSSNLNPANRYTLRLLLRSLDNALAMSGFTYYEEPLSPSSGMQTQLPILLAEYVFRQKRDVKDYLALLDQTDEYFDALLVFEQEKAGAGLLMSASTLRKVLNQCARILTKEELAAGTHFLQTTFVERLQELYGRGEITQEEARYYLSQNNRLLSTVLLPAYEALYDGLFLLEDEKIPLEGLAAKPEGDVYYELLLASQTGSSRTIAEIRNMLTRKLEEEYQALQKLVQENPELALPSFQDTLETAFPYRNAQGMLADLQQRMEEDFPAFDGEQALPTVTVKEVSESLEAFCAPAFYLTPPLDDTSSNVIYINQKNSLTGLELYTTLAHEGYPGHMYQTVYNNRSVLENEDAYVRQILWYGGYLEGWALYVEFASYDYAKSLMEEAGHPEAGLSIQMERHNRSLLLCLSSLLDIMIHHENASYEQVEKILNAFGITEKDSILAVYEYLAEEPTNYLKYYLGYLEILELKKEARMFWGERYSDYAFHSFFLECGPSDFATMREYLPQAVPAGSEEELPLLDSRLQNSLQRR